MSPKKISLVTGGTGGIGSAISKTLSEAGFIVIATCRPSSELSIEEIHNKTFSGHDDIHIYPADVSNFNSCRSLVETILLDFGPISVLINNAGIANKGTGPIEGIDMKEAKFLFEVNTFGSMRVVQAFLPMIRKGAPHSRIINFASGAVRANPVCSGSYNMSKWAVEGLTCTLRNELAPLGIQVTSIEPGAVKTHMTANAKETTKDIWTNISNTVKSVYQPFLLETTTTKMVEQISRGNDPDYVTEEVLSLLNKKKWKPRYLVGKDVKPMKVMLGIMSESLFEKTIQKAVGIPQYKG